MEGLATESGKLLLTQGVLGLAVLALAMVVVILYRALIACQDARIKTVEQIVTECTRCITNASQHIALSAAASQTQNSVNESRLLALTELNKQIEALAVAIDVVSRDVREVREETRRR